VLYFLPNFGKFTKYSAYIGNLLKVGFPGLKGRIWNSGLGSGYYLWRGVAPKRNVLLGKIFADPTIMK
jgi:hypothetical protein